MSALELGDAAHAKSSPIGKDVVLLFYPPLAAGRRIAPGEHVHIPISMLVLASVLRDAGLACEMYDMRDPDVFAGWENRVRQKLDRVIAAGISCSFTGQVPEALVTARAIRKMAPQLPLVWGGWHPWVLDEETARSPYVDVVARGMGELNAVSLFTTLRDGSPLREVAGITFRDATGRIVQTELPPFPTELPRYDLPYDELDIQKYEIAEGRISVFGSTGCPQRCAYCQIYTGFKRHWIARETPVVLDEMEMLVRRYGIKHFVFLESNFFTNRGRVRQICEGILERGLKVNWEINGHVKVLARGEPDLYALMKEAGCVLISSGIESGSQRILEVLRKDYSPDEIKLTLDRVAEANIPFCTNFMVGLPGETMKDLRETFRLIHHISTKVETHLIKCFMYHPIPGSVLFEREAKEGVQIDYPKSLEEWGDLRGTSEAGYDITKPWAFQAPFLRRYRDRHQVTVATFYLWLGYISEGVMRRAESRGVLALVLRLMRAIARWRLSHVDFRLPIEWWAYRVRAWFRPTT